MKDRIDVRRIVLENADALRRMLFHPLVRRKAKQMTPLRLRRKSCSPFPRKRRKRAKRVSGPCELHRQPLASETSTAMKICVSCKAMERYYAKNYVMQYEVHLKVPLPHRIPYEAKQTTWAHIHRCHDHGLVFHDVERME